ncbi:MAG: gliding motility-associated C-terminal domain-containing protein [Saprospiraceae bacterium]|nr:gliding motility-associated C-terminal domain-containing protein [Saprospiraceae bacterium]
MSHRNGCNSLDSLMSLRYFTTTNEILFEIASNVNNYHSVRTKLNSDICWHRFTLVKFNLEYLVYIDNVLQKRIISKEAVEFSRLANLTFANSPCNNLQSKKFNGKIDEIKLYKRALSELEINKLFIFPDQIVTPNTTIFKGESISLVVGNTCANSINWSPSVGLDDINSLTPIATPDVSTTYKVSLDNGNCLSTDTVRIFVADKDKLDCDVLLLPKAFTPNNDGLNDRFGISNTFLIDKLVFFDIYSRSGSIIWETKELNDTWDGTFKNQPVNGGTYVVKIKYICNDQEKFYIDNFILLR